MAGKRSAAALLARPSRIDEETRRRIADIFSAMGDPSRAAILLHLYSPDIDPTGPDFEREPEHGFGLYVGNMTSGTLNQQRHLGALVADRRVVHLAAFNLRHTGRYGSQRARHYSNRPVH